MSFLVFPNKIVKNLVFGPQDPSHQVDLAEKIIFVFLIPRIAPKTAPKMTGILVSKIPIILGADLGAIRGIKKTEMIFSARSTWWEGSRGPKT